MLIWDKYENRYRTVIPVERIEQKIKELKGLLVDPQVNTDVDYAIDILQDILKESEEE